jgi:hypothetical protein
MMASDCTIPCNARALQAGLRSRLFSDETFRRMPVVLGAPAVGIVVAAAVLLVAPPVTAIVIVGWALVGAMVAFGQAWLSTAMPARLAMPGELARLVEENAGRIHEPRLPELRQRAAALNLDQPNFDTWATRVLQDLREATGEAWRCPCPKRRFPLPLPL